jgi:hypothetical protein
MQDLTKAIHELRAEMALLKYRLEQVERQGSLPRPLLQDWHVTAIMAGMGVIVMMLGYGLYLAANGGAG